MNTFKTHQKDVFFLKLSKNLRKKYPVLHETWGSQKPTQQNRPKLFSATMT